ncbi:MAG: type II toxin-antitoxin system RelE/ParE family toxin [Casimicrobiaceae bacterium]
MYPIIVQTREPWLSRLRSGVSSVKYRLTCCKAIHYYRDHGHKVIRSFRHKGLERLFMASAVRGVPTQHRARLERMLDRLDAASGPGDLDVPGWRFHPLRGRRKGVWAIPVSGNLRLTFAFDGEDAIDVDLEDYH